MILSLNILSWIGHERLLKSANIPGVYQREVLSHPVSDKDADEDHFYGYLLELKSRMKTISQYLLELKSARKLFGRMGVLFSPTY